MKRIGIASLLCTLALAACGGGGGSPSADESKTTQEIQAQAAKSDASALQSTIKSYEDAIAAQTKQVADIVAKIQKMDPGELLGSKGAELNAERESAEKKLIALKEKQQVYVQELAKKQGGK